MVSLLIPTLNNVFKISVPAIRPFLDTRPQPTAIHITRGVIRPTVLPFYRGLVDRRLSTL